MKTRFKLLSTSLIVALSFAVSQAGYGMNEDNLKNNNQKISLKKAVPSKMEIEWGNSNKVGEFSELPKFLTKKILDMAIYQQAIEDGEYPIHIELINKTFRSIIATDTEGFNKKEKFAFNTRLAFLEGLKVHYNITTKEQIEVFDKIYNSKLIYKPDPNSDNGKIELLISGLKHPLKGTFDLSKCGDAEKYLSINMGYRTEMNSENAKKVEIWFAPRFLVEKEFNTTAGHLKVIFPDLWDQTAQVGIFWNWGAWDNLGSYDYLTTQKMDVDYDKNLYEKWRSARRRARSGGEWAAKLWRRGASDSGSCYFYKLK